MAAKRKAAKAGAGAVAAGRAAGRNAYVQRLIEDEDLRENLRTAFASGRDALDRMSNKGAAKAVMDDRKTQRQLGEAITSLRDAADSLRGVRRKRRRRRRGGVVLVVLTGAGLALALNEDLRRKALDAIFGAEEEFEYMGTTTGGDSNAPAPAPVEPSSEPVEGAPPPAGPVGTA